MFNPNLSSFPQGFNDHQMSQLKKSEAFTREREKEIAQVSYLTSLWLLENNGPLY